MNKTFNLLFYVKRSKTIADGTTPIYLRITIDGRQTEISTKRYIQAEKWNNKAQKANGTSEEIKRLNAYLKTLEQQVFEAHHQLLKDKERVTTETLKNKLLGRGEKRIHTLITIFQDHNKKMQTLVGEEYSPRTISSYKVSLKHVTDFLQWKYQTSDIDIQKINHAFITDYEFYLRSVVQCGNNSAIKYIKNFGKIIRICIANNWLDKNPFINYKPKVKEVDRPFLDENEIQNILTKDFKNDRLNLVKDMFIFSCFTGLAYIDVKQLTNNNISLGIDGENWIFTSRQKTDAPSRIPILPAAQEIINKYKTHPQAINQHRLLPVLSNQEMNTCLREIANLCGIHKKLTFHTARHTFATTVTLTNGVPIESVSKMLGHTNIKTTQHYAKIIDKKVSEDMKRLREKFQPAISIHKQVATN